MERLAAVKKKKQAAAKSDDGGFDSAMELVVTSDMEGGKKTPLPKVKPKTKQLSKLQTKKQKVHDLQEGDTMLTPVAGVGLVRSPVWEYTTIVSHGKIKDGKSIMKMWYKMQCKLCTGVIRTVGKSTTPMLRYSKSRYMEFHAKVFRNKHLKGLSPEE